MKTNTVLEAVKANGANLLAQIETFAQSGELTFKRSDEITTIYEKLDTKSTLHIFKRGVVNGFETTEVAFTHRKKVYYATVRALSAAVKNANKTQYSAENIISDFENDAQGFLNQIPKLIDAGTLSAPVFEATTFTSQKFTYYLKGYKEDIKLIVKTGLQFKTPRSSKGEKVASIEFTFGENAAAENLKSRTVALRIG